MLVIAILCFRPACDLADRSGCPGSSIEGWCQSLRLSIFQLAQVYSWGRVSVKLPEARKKRESRLRPLNMWGGRETHARPIVSLPPQPPIPSLNEENVACDRSKLYPSVCPIPFNIFAGAFVETLRTRTVTRVLLKFPELFRHTSSSNHSLRYSVGRRLSILRNRRLININVA